MTAEPLPPATAISKKPDHVKRGLIAVGAILAIIVVGVGIRMALQQPKQVASAPPVQPKAPAADPQNTFLQEFDQQKRRAAAAQPQPASQPQAQAALPQGEIEAMQELRKSMSVKSAPARPQSAPGPAAAEPATPVTYQQRSQDYERQIQDLNRRIEEGKSK